MFALTRNPATMRRASTFLRWSAAALVVLGAACSVDDAARSPSGVGLLTSPPQSHPGATLVGEFIGHWDPSTRQFTLTPSYTRNDALGLTGEAWTLGASSGINVQTIGAKYTDGTNVYTSGTGSSFTTPQCSITSSYASVICAQVQIEKSTSGTYSAVDLEVDGLSTGYAVKNDDSGNLSTAETSAGIDASALGVWQWTSSVTNTWSTGGTIWQFDASTAGTSLNFGVRAWIQNISAYAMTFSNPNPDFLGTSYAGSTAISGTTTLTASASNPGALTLAASPSVSGSSAITFSGCSSTILAAGASCTVTATLTCPTGTTGNVSATAVYTNTSGTVAASFTAEGTCNNPISETGSPIAISTGFVGQTPCTASTGTATITNAGNVAATMSGSGPTVTPSGTPISFSGCTGSIAASGGTCTVTPSINCVSASAGSYSATAVYTDTESGTTTSITATGKCDQVYATCNALHTGDSSLGNGTYSINPPSPSTQGTFCAYCDMTTSVTGDTNGSGGWTLIESNTAGSLYSTLTQVTSVAELTNSYLAATTMEGIAGQSHQVMVKVYGSSTDIIASLYSGGTDTAPILHMRAGQISDQLTDWGGSTGFASESALWLPTGTSGANFSCSTIVSGGEYWPNVFWACGNGTGIHMTQNTSGGSETEFMTWNWGTGQQANTMEAYLR